MGFFSNIKNRARGMANDLAPSNMPMAPRRVPPPPMDLDRIMRGPGLNLPDMGMKSDGIRSDPRRSSPPPRQTFEELLASRPGLLSRAPQKRSGLGGLFRKLQEQIKNQQRPQQNLDFLSRLPQNMMPQVDFSNIPQLPENFKFNPQMGQMTPGYAVGGPLMGAAGKFLRRNTPTNNLEAIRRQRLASTQLGGRQPGGLVSAARGASPLSDSLRRGTENLIMGGTGAGVLLGLDGTQELREPFSKDNISFMSPEAFGRDMAQLRMDVRAVGNLAKNKAIEMGENINDYVSRAESAYDQQMNQDREDQRMQELDAQQGMQPFSALLGPDMPLTAPDGRPLSPMGIKLQEMINSGRRFITPRDDAELAEQQKMQQQEMQMEQQQAIDDMLLNLEKKN